MLVYNSAMTNAFQLLGIDGMETVVETVNTKEYYDDLMSLNDVPPEQIREEIHKKIFDLRVVPLPYVQRRKIYDDREIYQCVQDNECEHFVIKIETMSQYNIFGMIQQEDSFDLNDSYWSNDHKPFTDYYFRRKGEFFYIYVKLNYHSKSHEGENSTLSRSIERSPYSMLGMYHYIGNQSRNWHYLDPQKILETIKYVNENPPTVENHLKWMNVSSFHVNHKPCTCTSGCNNLHNHSEAYICAEVCNSVHSFLREFKMHPHMLKGGSYCNGSQSDNSSFREAQQALNPIAYLTAVISSVDWINLRERGSATYFTDCFEFLNLVYDNKAEDFIHHIKSNISSVANVLNLSVRSLSVFNSTDDHFLSLECYCYQCLTFRSGVLYGMKFDPTKLIFDKPYLDREGFDKVMAHFDKDGKFEKLNTAILIPWTGTEYDKFADKELKGMAEVFRCLADIDLNDPAYHIKKSWFDTTNTITKRNNSGNTHYYFLDKNYGLLRKCDIDEFFKSTKNTINVLSNAITHAMNIKSSDKDEIVDKIKSLRDSITIDEKDLSKYFNPIYPDLSFDEVVEIKELKRRPIEYE